MSEPNFQLLKRSRKKVSSGDLFAMLLPDDLYLFGRVISTTAMIGPMKSLNLLYVYKERSEVKVLPDRKHLSIDNLLIPPRITNRLGWVRGYFETLAREELTVQDVLPRHCFRDPGRNMYFDDQNHRLRGPIDPVGVWGLDSYLTIDDAVSLALGIPLAPD